MKDENEMSDGWDLKMPIIKNVAAKTIGLDITPVQPKQDDDDSFFKISMYDPTDPYNATFYEYMLDEADIPDEQGNPMFEHIRGRIMDDVSEDNIDMIKKFFKSDDVQIGDARYEWEYGGIMSGRGGESLYRDGVFVMNKLKWMS